MRAAYITNGVLGLQLSRDFFASRSYSQASTMKPANSSLGPLRWLTLSLLFTRFVHADPLVYKDPTSKVRPVVPLKAFAFPLEQVHLLPGPFKHAQDLDEEYLRSLPVDRLLHDFRVNAGLSSQAKPLGGWEAPDCELRGHFVGHYLSACALMYASTRDEQLKENGSAVVAGLAACQAKLGHGYLSAFPESYFDRVEKRVPVWAPYYTLHKIIAGLQDMYVYCGNSQALDVARKLGDWAIERNSHLSDSQMEAMLGTEQGGMNETLANLYALTGEEKYLQISLRFNHHAVIDPAEHQTDKLTGLHANTQIPKFIGTARQYELTGNTGLETAAVFFWNTVTRERSYVIGGDSDGEMFSPKEHLSQALGRNTTETCNTYNMLKLTRHLFAWAPNVDYADYYERALYNHILASQNPVTGMMCYYVPLRSGSKREFNTPTDSFWCCTGTGVENHAKHADSIYFHDEDSLFVNLFIASQVEWKEKGITVRQETTFPESDTTELRFTCKKPVLLTLNVRHPFWATNGFEVRLNGATQTSDSHGATRIHRTWTSGDVLTLRMPFALRTEAFADNPDRFAVLYGPLVLAAFVEPHKPFPVVVGEIPELLASLRPLPGKPNCFVGSAEHFRIPGEDSGREVILSPFYQAYDTHYVTYWDRLTPEQWAARQESFKQQMAEQRALDARTVDFVEAGDEQSEREHQFRGERTDVREFNDRSWRTTDTNGWFEMEMKVPSGQACQLRVETGRNRMGGGLRLFINGKEQGASAPQSDYEPDARTETYPLPPELLNGKERVTVRFQAPDNQRGRRVANVRVLNSAPEK